MRFLADERGFAWPVCQPPTRAVALEAPRPPVGLIWIESLASPPGTLTQWRMVPEVVIRAA